MNHARKRAHWDLLIATAIWGIAGPIIKFTLTGLPPSLFLAYRFGLSTLIALLIMGFTKSHLPKDKRVLWQVILYGFLVSPLSLGLLFFGLEKSSVLNMSIITLTNPLIVSVAGVMFLNEHITKNEKIGMAIALIGTLFVIGKPNFGNGNILIFGYLLANTYASILLKKLLRLGVSPTVLTSTAFIVGFLVFVPLAILTGGPSLTTIPFQYHLGVIYMAIFSGTIAYFLVNRAQKTIEVGEASLYSYLYPIFATPLAVLWLGEKISYHFVLGAILITIGIFVAETKKNRYNTISHKANYENKHSS